MSISLMHAYTISNILEARFNLNNNSLLFGWIWSTQITKLLKDTVILHTHQMLH